MDNVVNFPSSVTYLNKPTLLYCAKCGPTNNVVGTERGIICIPCNQPESARIIDEHLRRGI